MLHARCGTLKLEALHSGVVFAVAWSPCGQKVATACGDSVMRIISATSGKVELEVQHGAAVRAVAWSPAGDLLATGTGGNGSERKARVIDCNGDVLLQVSHTGFVRALTWDPSGTRLATGSDDGMVRLVDCESQRVERQEAHAGYVRAIAWSPIVAKEQFSNSASSNVSSAKRSS